MKIYYKREISQSKSKRSKGNTIGTDATTSVNHVSTHCINIGTDATTSVDHVSTHCINIGTGSTTAVFSSSSVIAIAVVFLSFVSCPSSVSYCFVCSFTSFPAVSTVLVDCSMSIARQYSMTIFHSSFFSFYN